MGAIIHVQQASSAGRLALIGLVTAGLLGLAAYGLGWFDSAAEDSEALQTRATAPVMAAPTAPQPGPAFPSIRVRLLGVTPGGAGAGSARLEVEGRAGDWHVGQEPFPGVVLRRVADTHVVLGYGEATRTVLLTPASAAANAPAGAEPPDLAEINRQHVDVRRLTFTRFHSADAFLRSVELKPHPRGGYEVRGVEAGSLYDKLGLQVGDVLYSLDTDAMTKIDDQSLEAVMQQTHYELDVYRNGQLVHLRYRFPTRDPGDEPAETAGDTEAPR